MQAAEMPGKVFTFEINWMTSASAATPLTPNLAGGTDIRWTGSFTEGLRGTGQIMRVFLRGVVSFLASRLVKAAERR